MAQWGNTSRSPASVLSTGVLKYVLLDPDPVKQYENKVIMNKGNNAKCKAWVVSWDPVINTYNTLTSLQEQV